MWISTWWNDLPIYLGTHLIAILAPAVLTNHSPRTRIQVSTWNHPGWLESVHNSNALGNNFNQWCNQAHMHLAISVTCHTASGPLPQLVPWTIYGKCCCCRWSPRTNYGCHGWSALPQVVPLAENQLMVEINCGWQHHLITIPCMGICCNSGSRMSDLGSNCYRQACCPWNIAHYMCIKLRVYMYIIMIIVKLIFL